LSRHSDGLRAGRPGFDSGSRFFFSPYRPEWLWGPPRLLPNSYGG
jgi:hypothetical protein